MEPVEVDAVIDVERGVDLGPERQEEERPVQEAEGADLAAALQQAHAAAEAELEAAQARARALEKLLALAPDLILDTGTVDATYLSAAESVSTSDWSVVQLDLSSAQVPVTPKRSP